MKTIRFNFLFYLSCCVITNTLFTFNYASVKYVIDDTFGLLFIPVILFTCIYLSFLFLSYITSYFSSHLTYIFLILTEPAHLILIAFSVYTNGKKLISTIENADQLSCLHGIRFISMMWVILGHRYVITTSKPLSNLRDTDKVRYVYIYWNFHRNDKYLH